MRTIILVLMSVGLGFVLGRAGVPQPDHTQIQAYMDCYDSKAT
jgi:hypothetical protein